VLVVETQKGGVVVRLPAYVLHIGDGFLAGKPDQYLPAFIVRSESANLSQVCPLLGGKAELAHSSPLAAYLHQGYTAPQDRVSFGLEHGRCSINTSASPCGSACPYGRNALACKVLMRDAGPKVTVEPILGYGIIKDLVVDMEPFFEQYRAVLPFLVNDEEPADGRERLQSVEERERYDDTTKCILCAACTTACPSFWANDAFVGPAAIVNAHRFIFDSRDRIADERLDILNSKDGVWRCRTIYNCTVACPRGIEITRAIGEVKQAILFRET
jgi:succinate dehydrogenase/fumarate reductase iron-sulfur protein